jgi:uncharacterized membrane protein YqhA
MEFIFLAVDLSMIGSLIAMISFFIYDRNNPISKVQEETERKECKL